MALVGALVDAAWVLRNVGGRWPRGDGSWARVWRSRDDQARANRGRGPRPGDQRNARGPSGRSASPWSPILAGEKCGGAPAPSLRPGVGRSRRSGPCRSSSAASGPNRPPRHREQVFLPTGTVRRCGCRCAFRRWYRLPRDRLRSSPKRADHDADIAAFLRFSAMALERSW